MVTVFPERTRDHGAIPARGPWDRLKLQASAVVTLTESGEMSIFDRSFPYVPEAVVIMGMGKGSSEERQVIMIQATSE